MQEQHHHKTTILGAILKYVVPLLITVGLCWLMFSRIDIRQMLDIIRHDCKPWWIIAAMGLSVFSHVFRAFRWRIQLQALGINAPRWVLVLTIFGTYAVNLVLPRLGEVWRCGYLANRQKAPFATVFGSMVADRFADTVTVLLLTVATFFLASHTLIHYFETNHASYMALVHFVTSPWLWAFGAVCIGVLWWLLRHHAAPGSVLYKIQDFIKGLWQGFAVIVKMPGKGRWLIYTVLLWGCYFTQLYLCFFAFPFTAEVVARYGIVAVLVTYVLSSVAMGVPSNGGIGPWQWAVMFALGIYGVDSASSGAFANLVMGSQTALLILLGIITFCVIALDNRHRHRIETSNTNHINIPK